MVKKSSSLGYLLAIGLLICNPVAAFDFSDLSQTSSNDEYEKKLTDALGGIFHNFTADLTKAYTDFSGDIAVAAVGDGEFSLETVENFEETVETKLVKFNTACDSAADAAMVSYYSFLDGEGRSSLGGKDEVAQNLLEALKMIKEDFEEKVNFFKVVMLSGGTLGDFAQQLADEVNLFNAESEAEFLSRQSEATKIVTRDDWEKFVAYMEHFGPTLGDQLLEDLGKTVGAVLESQLGKLGEGVAEFLGELTTVLGDYVFAKASEILEKLGETLTPALEAALEKIMPALEPMLKLIGKKLENASLELLEKLLKEIIRDLFKPDHEFKDVSVRTDMALCDEEKAFIEARMEKASAVLKEKFGISVPLKVAMMSSGGGLRAMFGYLGFALAAEEANVWDASLYSVGLSGSTWNVMPYSYAHALNGTSLAQYRDFLVNSDRFAKAFPDFSGSELGGAATWVVKEYGYELPFSSTDLTGLLFSHGCIMDRQAKVKISDMVEGIKAATIPLPLCAAVYYESNTRTKTTDTGDETSSEDKEKREVSDEELDKLIEDIKEMDEDDSESYLSNDTLDELLDEAAAEIAEESASSEDDSSSIEDVDTSNRSLGRLGESSDESDEDVTDLDQMLKDALAASAKDADAYTKQTEYGWIEWSPFEVGSAGLGGFIPTWAWGASFNNGKPVDGNKGKIPEYPMYTLMGTWGSAYAVTANDVIDRVPEKLPFDSFDFLGTKVKLPVGDWISTYFDTIGVEASEARLLSPKYYNYSQGLSASPLSDSETIELVDAGMDSNMPFPLLMNRDERAMDAIFIFHADPGTTVIFETIVMYFKRKGIAYPAAFDTVTEEALTSKPMTIFNDPREDDYIETLPAFIYLPFLDCPEHATDTFNFEFTGDQILETVNAASDMFASQVPEMTQVLQSLAQKRGDTSVELLDLASEGESSKRLSEVASVGGDEDSEESAAETVATTTVDVTDQDAMFNQLLSTGDVTIPEATVPSLESAEGSEAIVSSDSTDATTKSVSDDSDSVERLLSVLNSVNNG